MATPLLTNDSLLITTFKIHVYRKVFTLICIHVICTMYVYMQLVFVCFIPTIIVRGDMHNAHVFLFQCPLPSSCNDSYFITAFPTLFSSLPVQPQSVSIHTICCMCMHSCQIFALPSSCNDSYFIAAFPTLCSSLYTCTGTECKYPYYVLYVHAFLPNVWVVHVCPLHSSNVYTYIKDSLCFVLFPSLVPRLHT